MITAPYPCCLKMTTKVGKEMLDILKMLQNIFFLKILKGQSINSEIKSLCTYPAGVLETPAGMRY